MNSPVIEYVAIPKPGLWRRLCRRGGEFLVAALTTVILIALLLLCAAIGLRLGWDEDEF